MAIRFCRKKGLKWSLIDEQTGSEVNNRLDVAITPGISVVITLHGADLAILHNRLVEWRFLVIEGTYDGSLGSDLEIKDQLRFPIRNLAKIPN